MNADSAPRPMPLRSWAGLIVIMVSQAGTLMEMEPFYSWQTPISWTGYILLVDGIIWQRRRRSWLSDAPGEFAFLAAASVGLWIIFELYNKYTLHNWYYTGLPESLPVRYFGYAWSFATISPAIFQTGELFASLRKTPPPPPSTMYARGVGLTPTLWISMAAGVVMLAVPIVHPSTYLAAPVWLGFILLLDPLNARAGDESIVRDWREGRSERLVNLLGAGLVCGLLWEFWNYWAGTKWHYNVPILPEIRLFEMPILGFAGFPPFAVECFTMYVIVRRWMWRGARYPISV